MPLTSLDQYRLARNRARRFLLRSTGGKVAWSTLFVGTIPTTPTACDSATNGAVFVPLPASNRKLFLNAEVMLGQNTGGLITGNMAFADRLSHQGGLSCTTTAVAQTTNLPTAALTRYTSGDGVMIGVDIQVSSNPACTATVQYTNQDGVGGRVTPLVVIPAGLVSGRRFILPLQAGDTGVRSVQEATISGGTASGTFGITLFKMLRLPLSLPDLMGRSGEDLPLIFGAFPEVLPGACIEQLSITPATSLSLSGTVFLIEG